MTNKRERPRLEVWHVFGYVLKVIALFAVVSIFVYNFAEEVGMDRERFAWLPGAVFTFLAILWMHQCIMYWTATQGQVVFAVVVMMGWAAAASFLGAGIVIYLAPDAAPEAVAAGSLAFALLLVFIFVCTVVPYKVARSVREIQRQVRS